MNIQYREVEIYRFHPVTLINVNTKQNNILNSFILPDKFYVLQKHAMQVGMTNTRSIFL